MDKPLVSIITPAYNVAKLIGPTIESVQEQLYENWEMIIVDDGSTDNTAGVVQGYADKDKRVKYVHQNNAGQSAARNRAIEEAKGEYLAFLDADDFFLPPKLEEQVKYLEENTDCGVSYCKIHHFFNEEPDKFYYFNLPHPSGNIFSELLKGNFINPLTVVLRKSVIDKWGGFEPTFRRLDEQYLWLKLSYHGVKFCYLDQVLGHYRIHKTSLSNDPEYFRDTEIKVLELLEKMKDWMSPAEAIQYNLEGIKKKTRRRILIGRLLAMPNPLGRLLLSVYTKRRYKRLIPIKNNAN